MSISHKRCGLWALRRLWYRFFFVKNHGKMRTEVIAELELVTPGYEFSEDWYCPTGELHAKIYWEMHICPFFDHKFLIKVSSWNTIEKKVYKMQIYISHRQLIWSFSWLIQQRVGLSCLVNKSKIVFPAFTKPFLHTAVFAITLFVTVIMCCCAMKEATW